jgi:hypothetical protein
MPVSVSIEVFVGEVSTPESSKIVQELTEYAGGPLHYVSITEENLIATCIDGSWELYEDNIESLDVVAMGRFEVKDLNPPVDF